MYVPLFADIISAERWLMIMPMAVLSNFLIYCVVNAFTTEPGNILALNTVTNYGYKKGKPLFFGIFAGYYTWRSLAQTSIRAELPSGNVPTTQVLRRISRFSRSITLLVRMRVQCSLGKSQ